jgi:type I restriction enzyme S subunit
MNDRQPVEPKLAGAPWRAATVADICEMRNGHGFGPDEWSDAGLPIIRIQNLNGGKSFDYFAGEPDPRWVVEPGQLLFAWAGTKGVSFGPTVWRGPTGVLNQHIFKVSPREGIDPDWLYCALRHVTDRIEGSAHGFKATLVHVKKSDIDSQGVHVPEKAEQQRIAQVLSTWDAAIAAAERLAANAISHRAALIGQTLVSKARASRWPMRQISDIATRVQRREAAGGELPVLMISSASGFVRQDQMYSRYMAGKSVENYIALEEGEFAYNKGNSKRYEFGCVYPLKGLQRGLVPHVYVCFRLHDEHDAGFFEHLFAADYLHDQLGALVNTGVRNNGLLNIRPADFMACQVPVPPRDVQERIAARLAVTAEWVRRHVDVASRLREEKAALMADLLTGKRRVRLPAAEATP